MALGGEVMYACVLPLLVILQILELQCMLAA